MKRSISAFLLVVALGLGGAFVATAVMTSYAVANGGSNYAPPDRSTQ